MNVRRQGAVAAIIAAGLLLGFTIGTASATTSLPRSDDSDYADQIAQAKADLAANQQAQDELNAALEYTSAALIQTNNQLQNLEARLPAAQAELAQAEDDLQVALQYLREVQERLDAAEAEDSRITEQIATDTQKLNDLRAIVAELAREAYRGESSSQTLSLVLGAKTTDEFITDFTSHHTLSRTEGNALAQMEQIVAMNRNRGTRQAAVKDYIAQLKVQADEYVAQADAAREVAAEKKAEIEQLLVEQEDLKAQLERQRQEEEAQAAQLEADRAALKDDLIALISTHRGSDVEFFDGVWRYPVAHPVVVSPYGMRYHPILHVWRLHAGTDFRAPCGTPILATASGWVEWAKMRSGYGNQVLVNSGEFNGVSYMASYNHLSAFNVTKDDFVVAGDVVGYAGTTGLSTGCHLHFEIYVNGNTVNPMSLLPPL